MKLFAGLFAAVVLSCAGLVAVPPADADPYAHTVTTTCHATAKRKVIPTTVRPRFFFWVTTDGNGSPHTTVKITVKRVSTGAVVRRTERQYDGEVSLWSFRRFQRPGAYRFIFRTATGPDSVYQNCSVGRRLRVVR